MFSRAVTSDKTNCFDTGVIANSIHCWNRPVHDIDDTWREPSSLTKFGNDHRCSRVTFRGFQDKSIPSYSGHRDRPEWDHPIDVCCVKDDITIDRRTHAGKLNGAMLGKSVSVDGNNEIVFKTYAEVTPKGTLRTSVSISRLTTSGLILSVKVKTGDWE